MVLPVRIKLIPRTAPSILNNQVVYQHRRHDSMQRRWSRFVPNGDEATVYAVRLGNKPSFLDV